MGGEWVAGRTGSTRAWRQRRAWWARRLTAQGSLPCARNCGRPIVVGDNWDLDHYLDDDIDEHSAPSHRRCNQVAGQHKALGRGLDNLNARRADDDPSFLHTPDRETHLSGRRSLSGEPAAVGLTEEAARAVPWLTGLAETGPGWAWPRLFTGIHADAAGSYGAEAITAIERWSGRPLWPWQRLLLARVLEHDVLGRLVWRSVGLSVPRRMGKSTAVGELASWRLQSGARFGGPQNVLLVARDVGASVTVQKPHRLRAEADRDRFKCSAAGGRLSIEFRPDGGEWLIRSSEGVYSYGAVMAIADEAWDLAPSVVDDGLHPTILQQTDAQLWTVSTANPRATGLMLGRRAAALAELDAPSSTLWVEWSASPDADVSDPAVWRAACPRWTDEIAAQLAELYASAVARRPSDPVADDPVEAFAAQYLNRWPASVEPVQRGEPLVDMAAWAAAEEDLTPVGALVVAVEDHQGAGAAAVIVGHTDDGRLYLEGSCHDRRTDAFAWARQAVDWYPASRLLVGASIVGDPDARQLRAKPVTVADTRTGLALLRELLAEGRVAHCLSPELADQLARARVTTGAAGLGLVPGPRSDLLRATLWALVAAVHNPPRIPAIH